MPLSNKLKSAFMNRLLSIIAAFSIFLLFSSCDKEPDRPDYFYSFKIDGVEKRFKANSNSNIVYLDNVPPGVRVAFFSMATGNDETKNTIFISLRTVERIELNFPYTSENEIVVQNKLVPIVTIVYTDENGKQYLSEALLSQFPGNPFEASISMTNFTTEGSTGEFSGVMYDATDSRPMNERRTFRITEGKYFLPNFVENR